MATAKSSVPALLEQAQDLMDRMEVDAAIKFFQRALALQPENTAIMDSMAEACLEIGDVETAEQLLQESIAREPSSTPAKWMYMGQLREGKEAVDCYQRGIDVLNRMRAKTKKRERKLALSKQIAAAHCSIAELYMTDLCMEEDAEQQCEQHLQQALSRDPSNPEVTQAMASMRISQQNLEDANTWMDKTVELLQKCDENNMPNYGFRMMSAKLLMELTREAHALDILDALLHEDDSNMEVWFLAATCCRVVKELELGMDYVQQATELIEKKRKTMRLDEEELAEVAAQLAQFGKLQAQLEADIAERGPVAAAEEGEEEEDGAAAMDSD